MVDVFWALRFRFYRLILRPGDGKGGKICLFLLGASLFSLCFCLLAGRYSTAAAAAAAVNVVFFRSLVVEVIIYTTDMTADWK